MHPYIFQERKDLLEWCTKRGIMIQAYGSLLGGQVDMMTEHSNINELALKYHKTPAQIFLRWGFQMGFHLIPKSIHEDRMIENSNIFNFQLKDKEMNSISEINGTLNNYWNPLNEPVDIGDLSHKNRHKNFKEYLQSKKNKENNKNGKKTKDGKVEKEEKEDALRKKKRKETARSVDKIKAEEKKRANDIYQEEKEKRQEEEREKRMDRAF
tara:strand:+ start:199 stop:831 length:633 start_codon:yes stop_codon:yes gene_type:complete